MRESTSTAAWCDILTGAWLTSDKQADGWVCNTLVRVGGWTVCGWRLFRSHHPSVYIQDFLFFASCAIFGTHIAFSRSPFSTWFNLFQCALPWPEKSGYVRAWLVGFFALLSLFVVSRGCGWTAGWQ